MGCGLLIEYFGINADQAYNKRAQHKLRVYAQNRMNVVPVFPQDLEGSWQDRLLARIDRTLDKILSQYRIATAQEQSKEYVADAYSKLR